MGKKTTGEEKKTAKSTASRAFWAAAAVCLVCLNSIAATLWAGVPALDNGGGFINLSPSIDCVLWGVPAAVAGVLAVVFFFKKRPGRPRVPKPLAWPAAWLAAWAAGTLLVFVLGIPGLFDRYGAPFFYLPWFGYGIVLVLFYLVCGWLGGRRSGGTWRGAAFWCAAACLALGALGAWALQARWAEIKDFWPTAAQIWAEAHYNSIGFTWSVMDTLPGALLGRLDLPACVLMDDYFYQAFTSLGEFGPDAAIFRERILTALVCLLPPLLFTAGWLAGLRGKRPPEGEAAKGPEC